MPEHAQRGRSAGHHPTDPPRGDAIRELYGWRVLFCSDVRHSWVEIEPPSEPVELTPAMAHRIAHAIRSVAQYTGDIAVKHFVESDR